MTYSTYNNATAAFFAERWEMYKYANSRPSQ